jgi:pyruvate dehydrogenase E2 component (dihydrolipoamide acetyltransferase)
MALTRVIMPKTGAEMEEGRILAWKRNVGERIEKGEVLLEIETDKATMEVEAPASGFLLKLLSEAGEVVPATQLIAVLGEADESVEELKGMIGERPGSEEKARARATVAEAVRQPPPPESKTPLKASPLARRLAQEKGIDLASIQGTGPGGRIEKDDVVRATETMATLPSSSDAVVSISTMRRAIARRMIRSKQEMADFSVTMAMDLTAGLRKKNELQAAGKHVSLNDLIVFAVARTLP